MVNGKTLNKPVTLFFRAILDGTTYISSLSLRGSSSRINLKRSDFTMSLNEPSVDFHLKMQEASFNVPYEAIKRNFKSARKLEEKQFKKVDDVVHDFSTAQSKKLKLAKLKQLIVSMKTFEKKMKSTVEFEEELVSRIEARIARLNELNTIQQDIADHDRPDGNTEMNREKLLNWYRNETNLLICDYLLKNNHLIETNPGLLFLQNLKFEKLIDYDLILVSNKISTSILKGDLSSLISWIEENKSYLKKIKSDLEFEARFQEYIEFVKSEDMNSAIEVFNDHLTSFTKTNFNEIQLAAGLLTFIKKVDKGQENPYFDKYTNLLSFKRYKYLSDLFLKIFNKMNGILADDPLLIYLSLGISSLKTRSCQCEKQSVKHLQNFESILNSKLNNNKDQLNKASTNLCPICSLEFRQLSEPLPYSHNVRSYLFDNPVMAPNGNIYDKEKLINFSQNVIGLGEGLVKDPITDEVFGSDALVTMYPT